MQSVCIMIPSLCNVRFKWYLWTLSCEIFGVHVALSGYHNTYLWMWIYINNYTLAHLYFNITERIYIENIRRRSAPSSWSGSISLIYTAAHRVQILYTLLQVGSLCDIRHIFRWDSTSSSTRCCPSGKYGECHTQILPVKEYII